jgi:hypothetical protein
MRGSGDGMVQSMGVLPVLRYLRMSCNARESYGPQGKDSESRRNML